MESRSLWRSLRRHWLVEVLIVAVAVAIAAAAAFLPTPKYQATTTVVVGPAVVDNQVPSGATDSVTFYMPALRAQVQGDAYRAAARAALDLPGGVSWTSTSTIEPASGVLHITISSTDRAVVAPLANAYADRLSKGIPGQAALVVSVLDTATRPSSSFSPDRPVLLVLGAGLGVVLALLLAALLGPGRAAAGARRSTGSATGTADPYRDAPVGGAPRDDAA